MNGNVTNLVIVEQNRSGFVTLEFIFGLLLIIIPLLIVCSEVYRVEQYGRKMLFSAQAKCISKAVNHRYAIGQENKVTVKEDVDFMDITDRVFEKRIMNGKVHFERDYYILSGTGME
ncbi:MAG: hypothetical protein EOM12_04225 [Verrucomicrobiae bacterium]|nr:hypothetical protein [Verrucomicrobiae bacterium]